MDLSEFSYLIKGYQPDDSSRLQMEIYQALAKGDLEQLKHMYHTEVKAYKESDQQVDSFVRALTIKGSMLVLDDTIRITKEETDFLSDYLFRVEMWGQYELSLFTEVAPLLSLELYYRYAREALVKTDHFQKRPIVRNQLQTILLNGFFKAMEEASMSKATYFKQRLEDFSFLLHEAYLKIIYLFALGCFTCLTRDKKEGEKQMADAVNTLKLLDYVESARYYEEQMRKWLEKFA